MQIEVAEESSPHTVSDRDTVRQSDIQHIAAQCDPEVVPSSASLRIDRNNVQEVLVSRMLPGRLCLLSCRDPGLCQRGHGNDCMMTLQSCETPENLVLCNLLREGVIGEVNTRVNVVRMVQPGVLSSA